MHARSTRKELVSLSTALRKSRLPEQETPQKGLVPEASAKFPEHGIMLFGGKDQEEEARVSQEVQKSALPHSNPPTARSVGQALRELYGNWPLPQKAGGV